MITRTGSGTTSPTPFYTSTLPSGVYRVRLYIHTPAPAHSSVEVRVGRDLAGYGPEIQASAQHDSGTGNEKSWTHLWLEPGDVLSFQIYSQFVSGSPASFAWEIDLGISAEAEVLGE